MGSGGMSTPPVRGQASQLDPTLLSGVLGGMAAFLAAFDPNFGLRYGPILAVAAFFVSRPARLRIGRTEVLMFAYLLWVVASNLWAQYPDFARTQTLAAISVGLLYLGMKAAARSHRNAQLVLGGYCGGAIFGILIANGVIPSSGPVYRDQFGRITQVGSVNINYVAYTALTSIVLILVRLRHGVRVGSGRRLLLYAALGVSTLGAILSGTRGVQVSLLLLVVWYVLPRLWVYYWAIAAISVAVALAVSAGWVDLLLGLVDVGQRSKGDLSGRLPLWENARTVWYKWPLAGGGMGVDRATNVSQLATHNVFLGVGASLGAIGLVLLIGLVRSSLNDRVALEGVEAHRSKNLAVILAFMPVLLTSAWHASASGWAGLALLSSPLVLTTFCCSKGRSRSR